MLHDLIVAFGPRGHYSVRSVEDECGPAVHCAFEHKADADRLAVGVGFVTRNLSANLIAERLHPHFPVLYRGAGLEVSVLDTEAAPGPASAPASSSSPRNRYSTVSKRAAAKSKLQ